MFIVPCSHGRREGRKERGREEGRKEGGISWRSDQMISGITLCTQPSTHGGTHFSPAQYVFHIPRKVPSLLIFPRSVSLYIEHNLRMCPDKIKIGLVTAISLSPFFAPIPISGPPCSLQHEDMQSMSGSRGPHFPNHAPGHPGSHGKLSQP